MPSIAEVNGARALRQRCLNDPLFFAREILGVDLWSKQVDILLAIRDHRRVAVRSGHGVGKTFVLATAALQQLVCNPGSKVVTTAPTANQVRTKLWREIRKLHSRAKVRIGGELLDVRLLMDREGWEAVGISTVKQNTDAFQGTHAEHVFVAFDEAQGVPPAFWEAAKTMTSTRSSRLVVVGNPLHRSGDFFDCFHEKSDQWHCIQMSCLEHPNLEAERRGERIPFPGSVELTWLNEYTRENPPGSALYESRVRGEFPTEGDDSIVPLSVLERAKGLMFDRHSGPNAYPEEWDARTGEKHLGLDVAREGEDSNVVTLVIGRRAVEQQEWTGHDLMATCGRVKHLAEKWGVDGSNIHVDVAGVGAGVVDRLREQGLMVDAVTFGAGMKNDWRSVVGRDFRGANRKAELYWALRVLLSTEQFAIDPSLKKCWAQLVGQRFEFDSRGHIRIEDKGAVKSRSGRSPDHADSVVLALARSSFNPMYGVW